MTLNERLRRALEPLGLPVVPGVDARRRERVITFQYNLVPCQFTDNRPGFYLALVQVHLLLPLPENALALRREIVSALAVEGFTWPEVTDAGDGSGQHWVFECQRLEASPALHDLRKDERNA